MFRMWMRILMVTLLFLILFMWNLRLEYEIYESRKQFQDHVEWSTRETKKIHGGMKQIDENIKELISLWKKNRNEESTKEGRIR